MVHSTAHSQKNQDEGTMEAWGTVPFAFARSLE